MDVVILDVKAKIYAEFLLLMGSIGAG